MRSVFMIFVAAYTPGCGGESAQDFETHAAEADTTIALETQAGASLESGATETFENADTQICAPLCDDRVCGSDGCGGLCGTCGEGQVCIAGECLPATKCEELVACLDACLDEISCTASCSAGASDEAWQRFGEYWTCIEDYCGPEPSSECREAASTGPCAPAWAECTACERHCPEGSCGTDGCGGLCGPCALGEICNDGACATPCETSLTCADDEVCAANPGSQQGICMSACVSRCPPGEGLQQHDGCHCRPLPTNILHCNGRPCSFICPGNPYYGMDGTRGAQRLSLHVIDELVVEDDLTGLQWTRAVSDPLLFDTAASYCDALPTSSADPWRVPRWSELNTLVWHQRVNDYSGDGWWGPWSARAWDSTVFGDRQSTPRFGWGGALHGERPMIVDFRYGTLERGLVQGGSREAHVRCVRGDLADPLPHRYVTLAEGGTYDRVTGLRWMNQAICRSCGFAEALAACKSLGDGWRMPTIRELTSLFADVNTDDPCGSLGVDHVCNDESAPILLSSTEVGSEEEHWFEEFGLTEPSTKQLWSVNFADVEIRGHVLDDETSTICVQALADGDGVAADGDGSGAAGDTPCAINGVACDDNCPGFPSSNQTDADGDGLGAPCDPCEDDGSLTGCIDHCQDIIDCASTPCAYGLTAPKLSLVVCGWCDSHQVCEQGQCVEPTCELDSDCSDTSPLPAGLRRRCDTETHTCELRFNENAEVLHNFARIHRGAAIQFAREHRLQADGSEAPCPLPRMQGVTPIEGTCCSSLGGPDANGDGLCDGDPTAWDSIEKLWTALGFRLADEHAAVYAIFPYESCGTPREGDNFVYEAFAHTDLDCNGYQETFSLIGRANADGADLLTPDVVGFDFQAPALSASGEIRLDESAQELFVPPGLMSLNPHFDEVYAQLSTLAEAAATVYSEGEPGSCVFPADAPCTPEEQTCCSTLGGPGANTFAVCDPQEDIWDAPGWQELGFSIATPHAFVYQTDQLDLEGAPGFRVRGYADLDCNGIRSTFARFVRTTASSSACEAEVIPGFHVVHENN